MLRNEKGLGIALSLMAIVLISLLGTAIVIRSISLAQVVNQKNYSITAVEAAKAGISHGIYAVEDNIAYESDITYTPVYDYTGGTQPPEKGYYQVEVTNNLEGSHSIPSLSTGYDIPAGCVEIIATGYAGNPASVEGAKKHMKIIAIGSKLMDTTFPMDYAVYAGQSVGGSGNGNSGHFFTDSYDSRDGEYDPDNPGDEGDIGCNCDWIVPPTDPNDPNTGVRGTIDVPRKVNGDVHVTQDYYDSDDYDVPELSGEVDVMSSPMEMLIPVAPTLTDYGTAVDGTSSPPPGRYTDLGKLSAKKDQVTLSSGKYIFTSIDMSGQGKLILNLSDTDGDGENDPVEIWVEGDITLTGSALTNSEYNPPDLLIYGTEECTSVEIKGHTNVKAAIYAPAADIDAKGMGNADIYGCLVGKTVDFRGANCNIHYDEALAELGGAETYLGLDQDNITWVIELQ